MSETKPEIARIERRYAGAPELREVEGKSPVIAGYAAVFNREAVIGGWFREMIAPGAFTRAIAEKQDVRGLFNHDPNMILGRTEAGTLRLSEDEHGLAYEIDPADTQLGRDLVTSIRRGDVTQSSFAFTIRKQEITEPDGDGKELALRVIRDVDLYDVSPVTYPAYENTEVSVRSMFPDGLPDGLLREQAPQPAEEPVPEPPVEPPNYDVYDAAIRLAKIQ